MACKTCVGHSDEWNLSKELAKSNKRTFVALILVVCLWFATIFGFVWYLNQYDYATESTSTVTETVEVDGKDGGTANYIGNDGDIYNGEDHSQKSNAHENDKKKNKNQKPQVKRHNEAKEKMKFYFDEWEEIIKNCGFTDDELNVVALLRRGWYAVDIAEELSISKRTVERRKKCIKQKITRYMLKS